MSMSSDLPLRRIKFSLATTKCSIAFAISFLILVICLDEVGLSTAESPQHRRRQAQ